MFFCRFGWKCPSVPLLPNGSGTPPSPPHPPPVDQRDSLPKSCPAEAERMLGAAAEPPQPTSQMAPAAQSKDGRRARVWGGTSVWQGLCLPVATTTLAGRSAGRDQDRCAGSDGVLV